MIIIIILYSIVYLYSPIFSNAYQVLPQSIIQQQNLIQQSSINCSGLIQITSSYQQCQSFAQLKRSLIILSILSILIDQFMDNQFISAPLLVNKPSPYLDPKDQLIKGLELKNNKLKTQLIKIQRLMDEKFQSMEEEEGPKKRQSIFQSEDNFEVLNKELANTYKRIHMYEYQIKKLEEPSKTVNIAQKATQVEHIIKEKKAMAEKLKQQITKQQKITQQNIRRLSNDSQKEEIQSHLKKMADEVKFFKEKIKFLQSKQSIKTGNMKKQYDAIKKFEKELIEVGMPGEQLEELKQKAIRGGVGVSPNKKNMNQSKNFAKEQNNLTGSDEQVQDRTKEHFQSIMGQISLLEKMHNDHQRQLIQAQQDKQQAIKKNLISRNKLLECENEIENLQKEIQIIKNRVIPSNLKPLKPLRSFSSHQAQNIQKIMPSKIAKNKSLSHLLKYDEVGMSSGKGQRFTDRNVLGKSNLGSKIVGIKIYLDKASNLIAGIQVTYIGKKKGGDYIKKDKQSREAQYVEQQFICKGSNCVRSISGTLNTEDKLQSLTVASSDGSSHKFGIPKTTQKHFNFDISSSEYPVCVFGSLLVTKQPGKKQNSLLQHLGFEIQNDGYNSHSVVLNQFNQ